LEVEAVTTAVARYCRRLTYEMPKLPPQVLQIPFYLYHSVEDARSGAKFGGTGFFVGYPTGIDETSLFIYAVTNWHVAVRDGASIIRVNKKGGGIDVFEFDPSEWSLFRTDQTSRYFYLLA